jgi:CHAT domain-containing protein
LLSDKRIYECQQTQCSQLSQLLDQRQTLTEQFNQKIQTIEKDIRERRAKDDAFFDPNKLSKAKEIVESQPGTILIYPLVLPDKIWLLWTSQGGIVKSVEVPYMLDKSNLGETVLKFRQLLQNPNSDITQVKATGKQLYDWLIKPIEPELKANKIQNLVFSLDQSNAIYSHECFI